MEDSRKGKRSRKKGLPPPDPHVDGGNGKNVIVYNTKKREKKGGLEKKKREKEHKGGRNTTAKRKEFRTLRLSTRACPRILSVYVRV